MKFLKGQISLHKSCWAWLKARTLSLSSCEKRYKLRVTEKCSGLFSVWIQMRVALAMAIWTLQLIEYRACQRSGSRISQVLFEQPTRRLLPQLPSRWSPKHIQGIVNHFQNIWWFGTWHSTSHPVNGSTHLHNRPFVHDVSPAAR